MSRTRRRDRRARDRDVLREAQDESNWSSFTWHFRHPGSLRSRDLSGSYSTWQVVGGVIIAAIAFSGVVFILVAVLRLIGRLIGGTD
jgi:hypothetical protein